MNRKVFLDTLLDTNRDGVSDLLDISRIQGLASNFDPPMLHHVRNVEISTFLRLFWNGFSDRLLHFGNSFGNTFCFLRNFLRLFGNTAASECGRNG